MEQSLQNMMFVLIFPQTFKKEYHQQQGFAFEH